ncbi:MAG: Rab family GTPase [Promethearchaeota archaeon]
MPKPVNIINVKLVIFGEGGVGKTSLVNSYLGREIPELYLPTIGSNIQKKKYELKNKDLIIRISIWDVGGRKTFNPLNPTIYNNIDAAFLVFDLSNPKNTLSDIKNIYLKNLEKYAKNSLNFIVGNKSDLISDKKDLKKNVKKYLNEEIPLLLISAKSGKNINDIFEILIYRLLQEWEINSETDQNLKGMSGDFLKLIGKSDNYLNSKFIIVDNLDLIEQKVPELSQISKKVIKPSKSKNKQLFNYIPVEQDFKKMILIKNEIIDSFNKNLTKVEKLINVLKKTPIDCLIDSIESTAEQINDIKHQFKLNLDSIINLEKVKEEMIIKNEK